MAEKNGLKKGYFLSKSNGKEYLRYKYNFNGKTYYHSCKYDPRKYEDEAYEEIRKWKYTVENPNADERLALPKFVKKYTLDTELADALTVYVKYYKNIDRTRQRLKRPANETIRTSLDTINRMRKYPIGSIKLKDLKEEDIQDYIFDLADKHTYERKGKWLPYGKASTDKTYALLKGFAKDMGWEKIIFSDVKKAVAQREKFAYHSKEADPEKRHFTDEERERYIEALMNIHSNDEARDAVLIELDSGIRPEEVRGLRACDYDAEKRALRLVQSIPRGEDREVKVNKTDEDRWAPLTDAGVKIIKKHLKDCYHKEDFIFKRMKPGKSKEFQSYVCRGSLLHVPLSYQTFYRMAKKAAKVAGITEKNIFPYTTRQTLVNDVFDKDGPKAAQAVAGHKRLSTTIAYYLHEDKNLAFTSRDRRNAQQLDYDYYAEDDEDDEEQSE